jgi:hypothetical protein
MPYAISKLMQAQFQVSAYMYTRPLGELPGSMLTWSFLGYSPWFQVFLGFTEFVPGVLLFFRRTKSLGSVLLIPVLLNVWLINLALNLWPVTQKISAAMLFADLYLVACDFPKHSRLLGILLDKSGAFLKSRSRWIENAIGCCLLTAALTYAYSQIHSNVISVNEQLADFIGDRQINRKGQWRVEEFRIDGHDVMEGAVSRMYFDLWRNCLLVRGDLKTPCAFQVDRNQHAFRILSLRIEGDNSPIAGTYRVSGDTLTLTGKQQKRDVRLVLLKDHWGR